MKSFILSEKDRKVLKIEEGYAVSEEGKLYDEEFKTIRYIDSKNVSVALGKERIYRNHFKIIHKK